MDPSVALCSIFDPVYSDFDSFVVGAECTYWNCQACLETNLPCMINPILSLLGALVLVGLLMAGDESSSAMILGRALATATGGSWQFFSTYLGAIGSFFAGSCTISNLTFGPIQDSIVLQLSLNRTTILALQSVGGAMGNMIAIHNIVAVCSVLGLENQEGEILKRTVGRRCSCMVSSPQQCHCF